MWYSSVTVSGGPYVLFLSLANLNLHKNVLHEYTILCLSSSFSRTTRRLELIPSGTTGIFIFITVARIVQVPTQTHIQCPVGALSLETKMSGCEVNHLSICTEIKNMHTLS